MNTRYELARFDAIISKDIGSFIKSNCKLDQPLYFEFKLAIKEETERIKSNLSKAELDFKKRRTFGRYIRFHQQEIIRLSGQLSNYISPQRLHTISESLDNALLCQQLYLSLEELLAFVAKHFTEYFNQDAWMPESYRRITIYELQKSIRRLHITLIHLKVDKILISIVLNPFKEIVDAPSNEVTYRRMIFLKAIEKEILIFPDSDIEKLDFHTLNQRICESLIRINYNSPEFIKYYSEHIRLSLFNCEFLTDQIDRIAYFYKIVYQIHILPNMSFNPSLPSTKNQLLEWLSGELEYLRQKQLLKNVINGDHEIKNDFKLNFNLSVAQLAYFLKALIEADVIQNKNTSELIRFLTKYVKTKRSESMSYESFRIKYYSIESGTKDAVKKTLEAVLNFINKN